MTANHHLPEYNVLKGLPPYGPLATAFPNEWGRLGREGIVVGFETRAGRWVANFQPGIGGLTCVLSHPNGREMLVIASGDLWSVDLESRQAELLLPAIDAMLQVQSDEGEALILSRQGLALAKLGQEGVVWHTRRLSWDGIDELKIVGGDVIGMAWSPFDQWYPFRVDIHTGKSQGGSYSEADVNDWEQLAIGD